MKKKLIIHGGMHKTGSSAIQTLLQDNRNELLAKGVYIPDTGTIHHPGIGRRHYYVRETLFGGYDKRSNLFPELLAEIGSHDCHTVVLSYENFLSPGKFVPELAKCLRDNFEVYFLCYLRDPVSYYNAKYKEWLRRLNFKGESGDFILSHFGYIDWQKLLEPWTESFGLDHVTCRKFDRSAFVGGKVEFDFLEYLKNISGVTVEDLAIGTSVVNPSFNNDKVLASLLRNRYFGGHKSLSPKQKERYRGYLDTLNEAPNNGLILSENAAKFLTSQSKAGRDFVAQNMGVDIEVPAISKLDFDGSFHCVEKRAKMKKSLDKLLSGRGSILMSSFKQRVKR